MDHAGAEDRDPACAVARATARTVAVHARDVDPHAGLRVRVVLGLEPDATALAEQRARHERERALEVREREPAVDPDPLELVEHREVCRVDRLIAVHAAEARDADRQDVLARFAPARSVLQDPRLHGGGVAAQQQATVDPERVLHVARGVVLRDVEGVEVVERPLDLRPVDPDESEPAQHVQAPLLHGVNRVDGPLGGREARRRQVLPLAPHAVGHRGGLDPRARLGELRLHRLGRHVERLGDRGPVRCRDVAQALEGRLQRGLLSGVRDAHLLDRSGVACRGEIRAKRGEQRVGIGSGHGASSDGAANARAPPWAITRARGTRAGRRRPVRADRSARGPRRPRSRPAR